ncbi:hypothetical protein [Gimesia panareensis]|uniref:hypothetical protein n=1 Tax=Gimesia panareensis TaxID=2527978 RepID=UPI001187B4BB|nr:hypothetical protein [Gimesia panareensis]QDU52139.1 hypothetical protein Pan110_45110 [Gimesia panareensis]
MQFLKSFSHVSSCIVLASLFLSCIGPNILSAADRERWSFSFLDGKYDLDHFELYGNLAGIKPTEDGLRMRLPPSKKKDWGGIDVRCRLEGDFKIIGKYTITELGSPEGGTGAGLSIGIKDTDLEWATVQHVKQRNAGEVIVAHRGFRKPDGISYESKSKSEKSSVRQGIVEIERKGKRLNLAASNSNSAEPVLIESYDYTDKPVDYLHVGIKQGGAPTLVDLNFTEISLEADNLSFDFEPENDWSIWIWTGVISVFVTLCLVLVIYKTRQANS